MESRTNVIFLATQWDTKWRRAQQFAVRFNQLDIVNSVVYVELPLTLTSLMKYAVGKGDQEASARWRRTLRQGFVSEDNGVSIVTPLSALPRRQRYFWFPGEGMSKRWVIRQIYRLLAEGDGSLQRTLILGTSPLNLEFADAFPEARFCYDYFGNYEGMYVPSEIPPILESREQRALRYADAVICQTPMHYESVKPMSKPTIQNTIETCTIGQKIWKGISNKFLYLPHIFL